MIAMVFLLAALTISATARELTFEMEAHSTQCFFEIIALHEKVTVEHEVSRHREKGGGVPLGWWRRLSLGHKYGLVALFLADQP